MNPHHASVTGSDAARTRPDPSLSVASRSTVAEPPEIHLWCRSLTVPSDAAQQSCMRDCLSEGEREREQRFTRADDALRFLVTRSHVRDVLARYTGGSPADLQFADGSHGKPYLASPQHAQVHFNLSHSSDLIVVAVSAGAGVGVDVEDARRRSAPLAVADRFFSLDEQRQLRAAGNGSVDHHFYRLWTLKEAYLKARGCGLNHRLRECTFDLGQDTDRLQFHGPDDEAWAFWQFQLADRFLLAVCQRQQAHAAAVPRLVWRATDGASWTIDDCRLIGCSVSSADTKCGARPVQARDGRLDPVPGSLRSFRSEPSEDYRIPASWRST